MCVFVLVCTHDGGGGRKGRVWGGEGAMRTTCSLCVERKRDKKEYYYYGYCAARRRWVSCKS